MKKIKLLEKKLEKDPNNSSLHLLLGVEYMENNIFDKSYSHFIEALNNCDDNLIEYIKEQLSILSRKSNSKNIDIKTNQKELNADKPVSKTEKKLFLKNIYTDVNNEQISESSKSSSEKKEAVKFNDVGGLDELKKIIRLKIIEPFNKPELFKKFNKKIGGGIILYGPPGCGKTFIAKATAGECKSNFISVHITDILDQYVGESEKKILNIFEKARSLKPCILFFDEIDTLGFNMAKLHGEYLRGTIDTFLSQLDGIDTDNDKILVIGASNMPWDIDSAFKRPGRFDRIIFVPPPDKKGREVIFKLFLKDKPADEINYSRLADKTHLYSGADIKNVVERATENVIDEIIQSGTERIINIDDLMDVILEYSPTTSEWFFTIKNYLEFADEAGIYKDVKNYIDKNKI